MTAKRKDDETTDATPETDAAAETTPHANPLQAGLHALEGALKSIRAGARTKLHLNDEQRAAVTEHIASSQATTEASPHHDVVRRLLAGEEVAGHTIRDDNPQTA